MTSLRQTVECTPPGGRSAPPDWTLPPGDQPAPPDRSLGPVGRRRPTARATVRPGRLLLALGFALALAGPAGPAGAGPASAEVAGGTAAPDAVDARSPIEAAPTRRIGGPWGWPLVGPPPVLRAFHPPSTPYGPGHRGVDLGGAPGDPVVPAGPGVVAFAGLVAGRGVVSVQHPGGLRTTYEPLAVTTRTGAAVSRRTVLGRLLAGHAGCPRPACLHWGLRRGEDYLDPLSLLGSGPVRLLPRLSAVPDG